MPSAFSFGVAQFKASFFDSAAILKEMEKVERQTLSRFGAFARRRMQTSIRYARGKSKPGRPPHAHKSSGFVRKKVQKDGSTSRQSVSPLRELIFFAYDAQARSVVVGPARFGGKGGIVPRLLEEGGPGVFRDSNTGQMKRGVWSPRPFVRPAAEAEIKAGKYLIPR